MTDRLSEIEARLKAATPGPWECCDYNRHRPEAETWLGVVRGAVEVVGERFQVARVKYSALPRAENIANADLIANAPSDIAWLIEQVRLFERQLAAVSRIAHEYQSETATRIRRVLKSASSAPSVVRRNEVQEQFADVANGRDEGASSAGNFTGNPDDAPSDTALLDWLGTHLAGTKWDDALPSIRPREEVKYIHGPNGLRQAIYEAMERGRRRETTGLRAPSGGTG